jgi:iron complex transport system substrate-binding protein
MHRRLTIAILIVLLLAACAPARTASPLPVSTSTATAAPTSSAITLTDGLGRTVTLASPAQRVVSLAAANTEILYAIGTGAQVVGRDTFSDYPEAAQSVQDIGGSMGEYNTEAIVALQPDLVLAGGINPPELVASLEQLGLTIYFLPNPTTLEEMFTNLETVATLTGHEADAAALIDSLKSRVAVVDAKVATVSDRPTVYYELDATDPTKPYTAGRAGPTNFVDALITRAGGTNIGSQMQSEWPQISLEQLLVDDPQIILLGDAAYDETPDTVAARPGWNVLTAVKDNHIYPVDYHLVSLPGPRLVDGLEMLAKLLHPDLFK